jgi:glycine hydroxymethyltransferase
MKMAGFAIEKSNRRAEGARRSLRLVRAFLTQRATMPTWKEPSLAESDPEIARLVREENDREARSIRLIPSENYASRAVIEASGSLLCNKYSEGYPGKRYYEGQQVIDPIEELARARMMKLFGAEHCNVQPYSGSPANLAVYFAFCKPGDPIMGLALPAGGHLTHGWNVSITGAYFKSVAYGVRKDDQRVDMDQVRALAKEHRPKLIWCGGTAYARVWDFAAFRSIADEAGAVLVADIAHIAGLVAGGAHPSPIGIADVVTTTTHKTLRGPRGGMIMAKKQYAAQIDKAVFPGLQGGPHNHTTAAIAVAAHEASQPSFKVYAQKIVENAKALAAAMIERGFDLVTGGTDNHLILCDLTKKGVSGKVAAKALDRAGLVLNYNSVPFDPRKPFDPSGIRLGTPGVTSRAMGLGEMTTIAEWMKRVVDKHDDESVIDGVRREVEALCAKFPAPGIMVD